jgi:hypothetical protein
MQSAIIFLGYSSGGRNAQEERCRAWAETNGYEVFMVHNGSLPSLKDVLVRGQISAVVAATRGAYSRSASQLAEFTEAVREHGIKVFEAQTGKELVSEREAREQKELRELADRGRVRIETELTDEEVGLLPEIIEKLGKLGEMDTQEILRKVQDGVLRPDTD